MVSNKVLKQILTVYYYYNICPVLSHKIYWQLTLILSK